MHEGNRNQAEAESVNSYWSEDTEPESSEPEEAPAEGVLVGIQEKPGGELLIELEALEEKVNQLIEHCEQLQRLNEGLTQQLRKESESRAKLLEVQTKAGKRVDQLIQRLRDLEEEAQ